MDFVESRSGVSKTPSKFSDVDAPKATTIPRLRLQRRLEVGAANDPSEREADLVADQVLRRLASSPADNSPYQYAVGSGSGRIRRMEGEGSSDEPIAPATPRIRRMERGGSAADGFTAAPEIESRIAGARGSGAPIEPQVRSRFEGAMGVDLSAVRVHHDASADQLSRAVSAKAFTTGNDVFFSKGTYDPHSTDGQRLLAHELTHTVQQGGSAQRSVRRELDDGASNPAAEARSNLKPVPVKEPKGRSVEDHHQTTEGLKGEGHIDEDLIILYQEAAVAEPELHDKTVELAAATNGEPKFPPGLKGEDRAREKIMADYGGKAGEICDLVRATVEYKSFADMMAGLDKCNQGFLTIVREKNRYKKPTPAGYRDICLNVQMSNGHIAELQMNLTQILAAKDIGHKQYEQIRSIEARFAGLNIPIPGPFRKTLDRLYSESKEIYAQAMKDAGAES